MCNVHRHEPWRKLSFQYDSEGEIKQFFLNYERSFFYAIRHKFYKILVFPIPHSPGFWPISSFPGFLEIACSGNGVNYLIKKMKILRVKKKNLEVFRRPSIHFVEYQLDWINRLVYNKIPSYTLMFFFFSRSLGYFYKF